MKVGDLVRWVMEEYELGIIVYIGHRSLTSPALTEYRVFCLSDGGYYHAFAKEIEVVDESG